MKANPFLTLKANILSITAEGPPCRRLKVRVSIENPSDLSCALLSSWTEASLNPGGIAVEGDLFEQLHAQAFEAFIRGRGSLNGEFSVPITPLLIDRVETSRA